MSRALKLKPQEQAFYDKLFIDADRSKAGVLDGGSIKDLFMRSQVPKATLAEIWNLSDRSRRKALDRDDFYMACRLIALAQQGRPVSVDALRNHTDITPANFGPGLNINASAPGGPVLALMPGSSSMPSTPAPAQPNNSEIWIMTEAERQSYQALFAQADADKDGYVGGSEAKNFFRLSGLDDSVLKRIWIMADVDRDKRLNPTEFNIAMHLVLRVRKKFDLPTQLPDVLHPSRLTGPLPTSSSVSSAGPKSKGGKGLLDSYEVESLLGLSDNYDPPVTLDFEIPKPVAPTPLPQPVMAAPAPMVMSAPPPMQVPSTPQAARVSAMAPMLDRAPSLGSSLVAYNPAVNDTQAQLMMLKQQLEEMKRQQAGYRDQTELSSHQLVALEEQKREYEILLREKEEIVKVEMEKTRDVQSRVEQAGQQLNQLRDAISKRNEEISNLKRSQDEMVSSIHAIKRAQSDVETEFSLAGGHIEQLRAAIAGLEEIRNAQRTVLDAKKSQLERMLQEKRELTEELNRKKEELGAWRGQGSAVDGSMQEVSVNNSELRRQLDDIDRQIRAVKDNSSALFGVPARHSTPPPPRSLSPARVPAPAPPPRPPSAPRAASRGPSRPASPKVTMPPMPSSAFGFDDDFSLGSTPAAPVAPVTGSRSAPDGFDITPKQSAGLVGGFDFDAPIVPPRPRSAAGGAVEGGFGLEGKKEGKPKTPVTSSPALDPFSTDSFDNPFDAEPLDLSLKSSAPAPVPVRPARPSAALVARAANKADDGWDDFHPGESAPAAAAPAAPSAPAPEQKRPGSADPFATNAFGDHPEGEFNPFGTASASNSARAPATGASTSRDPFDTDVNPFDKSGADFGEAEAPKAKKVSEKKKKTKKKESAAPVNNDNWDDFSAFS